MKKSVCFSSVILILLLIVGVSLLLYPTVSDYWNSFHQSRAVASYTKRVTDMKNEDYQCLRTEADAYNQTLQHGGEPFVLSSEEQRTYEKILDVTGTGIMAYIEIPKIRCELPIYHGTEEAILQVAIGHIPGSSLPVGGASTHCVLSGHRGLPSARLFTDLDQLAEGDTFFIHVLDDTLTYEVDQILTVEPEEIEELRIQAGEDYCTLVTCTPYGVNTHRLLVRGHRIEQLASNQGVDDNVLAVDGGVGSMNVAKKTGLLVIAIVMIGIGVAVVAVAVMHSWHNAKEDKQAAQNSKELLYELKDPMAGHPKGELEEKLPDYLLHPEKEMPVAEVNGNLCVGILEVPSYELTLPILNTWSDSNLKIAPCRYAGSAYQNNLVLAGHNYKSHFGRLKRLPEKDTIIFTDMEGNRFSYQVKKREVLESNEVEEMKTGDWDLTLFTCTNGGKDRLALRCSLVYNVP